MSKYKYIYKLTDDNLQTRNGFQYKKRRYVSVDTISTNSMSALCTRYWLHAYQDPLLAVFMSPAHIVSNYSRLFEARYKGQIKILADKVGVTSLALWNEIDIPEVTTTQYVAFGILAVKQMQANLGIKLSSKWIEWAENWLSGEDRSSRTANNAVGSAYPSTGTHRAAKAADAAAHGLSLTTRRHAGTAASFASSYTRSKYDLDLVAAAHEAIQSK